MDKFDIESLQEDIHFKETKLYFQEVMMTYQIGAYRSSVVTLWSVVVCDIVLRLQHLIDLYNDPNAVKIIEKIKDEQNKDSKSSAWELKILEEVLKQTQLINQADFENLIYLQKQRHLCAHPTLNDKTKLHKPNKETVRALIRNTLEGVLSKPPFYTHKIINTILEDLSEIQNVFPTRDKTKRYIEDRYLNKLSLTIELQLYRTLWKLTFKLNNDNCKRNRFINCRILIILTERHPSHICKLISEEKDYYSNNISYSDEIIFYLIFYLSNTKNIFSILSKSTQIAIKETCKTDELRLLYGWFTHENLTEYYEVICRYIYEHPEFMIEEADWRNIFIFSNSLEWDNLVNQLIVIYYCKSASNDIAIVRFQSSLLPFINEFNNREKIKFLLENIELSNELCNQKKLKANHCILRKHFEKILPKDFDFTQYPNFNNQTRQKKTANLSSLLSDTNED